MKTLRVKPAFQLPHVVSKAGVRYEFKPDCDLPDAYADALLKSQPHVFEPVKGEATGLEGYTFKESFKKRSMDDLFGSLTDEQKLEVYNFAKAVKEGIPEPPQEAEEEPEKPSGRGRKKAE